MRDDARKGSDKGEGKGPCQCPFCDSPVEASLPFCKACGREVRRCKKCGRVLAADERVCPVCK